MIDLKSLKTVTLIVFYSVIFNILVLINYLTVSGQTQLVKYFANNHNITLGDILFKIH
jgi:hypothetical protein